MPSSLIFIGLVVLWLLILVPAVARHQQEVARPSGAALSGRVLQRSPQRRRTQEVDGMEADDGRSLATRSDQDGSDDEAPVPAARATETAAVPVRVPAARTEARWWETGRRAGGADGREGAVDEDAVDRDAHDEDEYDDDAYDDAGDARDLDDDGGYDDGDAPGASDHDTAGPAEDDRLWERPPPRYRPGRGGFDPEAAALAARQRATFRQRVVLVMLVLAVATAVVAAVTVPAVWWAHGAIDVALVGYLVYLRRQVRMEEAIRARRAARMAGTRRTSAADDPELDEWARRGREVARTPAGAHRHDTAAPHGDGSAADDAVDDAAWTADDDGTERVRGAGEPVGLLPARRRGVGDDTDEPVSALPRLQPAPPPPLPPGTVLVEGGDDDPEEHDLGTPGRPEYRRAVGE